LAFTVAELQRDRGSDDSGLEEERHIPHPGVEIQAEMKVYDAAVPDLNLKSVKVHSRAMIN
jgi:hypothetical protein